MKLISVLFSNKALAVAIMIQLAGSTYASGFSSFSAKKVFWNKFEVEITPENMVVLTWNVTEYNNKNFSVELSANGIDWEDVDLVASHQSAESMTDYSYRHQNTRTGRQFYRLKAFDLDNKSKSISPIVTVVLENATPTVTVWPNPAINYITIAGTDKQNVYTKASVFDMSGKMMIESKLDPHITEVAVDKLLPGMYLVILENKNGTKHHQKFVKH